MRDRIARLGWLMSAILALCASAAAQECVTFPSTNADKAEITGYLFKPASPVPAPAVVGLHGCGGMFLPGKPGAFTSLYKDWAARWAAQSGAWPCCSRTPWR